MVIKNSAPVCVAIVYHSGYGHTGRSTSGSENDLNRLGLWLGAAAQSNVDEGPDTAPPESDIATACHLGRRVALVTLQFVRGRQVVSMAS